MCAAPRSPCAPSWSHRSRHSQGMRPLVLLESAAGTPVERVLETLGVVFERRPLAEALGFSAPSATSRPALILSEDQLSIAFTTGEKRAALLKELLSRYAHILVYPFQGTSGGLEALSACIEG